MSFDFDGRKAGTTEARNVYGMQMARASYEAALQNMQHTRPFILTRSAFAGVQRYAAVWSGDNQAKTSTLLLGQLLNTQMSLSGIPFVGPISAAIGDGNKELYKRWVEVGVFSPLFVITAKLMPPPMSPGLMAKRLKEYLKHILNSVTV